MQRDTVLMLASVFLSGLFGFLLSEWASFVTWVNSFIQYKWLLMISLTAVFALAVCAVYLARLKRRESDLPTGLRAPDPISDTFHDVLALIAKLHSQEIPATPNRIAAELHLDPGIALAHMIKYHNEQFITFRNNGKPPELDTSFFLSPKAWEQIRVSAA